MDPRKRKRSNSYSGIVEKRSRVEPDVIGLVPEIVLLASLDELPDPTKRDPSIRSLVLHAKNHEKDPHVYKVPQDDIHKRVFVLEARCAEYEKLMQSMVNHIQALQSELVKVCKRF